MKQKKLDRMTPEELGRLFPIMLSEPKYEWQACFKSEKEVIKSALGNDKIIRVEHIGSTAIPGLISKPTIDILVEITDEADLQQVISGLERINYHFIPRPENQPPHMMFVKGYTNKGFKGQAYHVHIRYSGDWDEIYFRDYLIKNPEIAHEYGKLKQELAKKYPNDRDGYTEAKTGFVKRVIRLAREEVVSRQSSVVSRQSEE